MPTVSFAGPVYGVDVPESAGYVERQVVLSAPSADVVTIVIKGFVANNEDIDQSAQTLVFQPGQTALTWRTAIVDDALYESHEGFTFTIVSATNADVLMSQTSWAIPTSSRSRSSTAMRRWARSSGSPATAAR